MNHPELKHGEIKILFTPDEEIGRGVDHVDIKKLGADFAYTVDGESLGTIENETFSADGVKLIIKGISAHPGFAKNKMESAIKIASEIISQLPKDTLSPESTSDLAGFIHPVSINGGVEQTDIEFIIRDFETEKLKEHEQFLEEIVKQVLKNYPNSIYEFHVEEQYRNMKMILDQYPNLTQLAIEAVERAGLEAKLRRIRGGTDGSRLSFMGLPCPNIFAGEHAFHSKQEWVSVQDMEKAVQTIVNLALIWEEKFK
jgi:tripeptide aminopeptidase